MAAANIKPLMIGTKHCRLTIVFIAILSMSSSLYLDAQSRAGAIKQMNQGNYSTAIAMLSGLEEMYPGQFSNDLRIAGTCKRLQRAARAKFEAQHYTEAESLYNQVLKLNLNDRDARQAIAQCQEERSKYWATEYAKCKTIADYRLFAKQYPESPEARIAMAKVEEYDLKQQDSNAWATAESIGTASSYSTYISKADSKASYLGEAYRNRARLYFKYAINASTDNYMSSTYAFYALAKCDYENAKEKGAYLLAEDNNKYIACIAEDKFHNIGAYPLSYSITAYISWANSYALSSLVYPHLHLETAYSMLVDAYCRSGNFDDARKVVEQHFLHLTSTYFTGDSSVEWSKSEWEKYIRKREKQFKKNRRKE